MGIIPKKGGAVKMERRKWSSQQKLQIVLEGLNKETIIEKLCVKYEITQAQYYKWRDQLLKYGHQAFETKNLTKKEMRLIEETKKLKGIIGDLTVELKKNEL